MNSNQTLTKRHLLHGTAALAILVAIMGCDSGQSTDDVAQAPTPVASTERATDDARPGDTENGSINPALPPVRDQNDVGTSDLPATYADNPIQIETAVAQIKPTSAGNAEGTVTFTAVEGDQEMRVAVELTGLEPGLHGFHIHEVGDCSADDASSAGGHFNPNDTPHGSPDADEHHVGDMGNIEADENGQVSSELSFRGLVFVGPASILDKAVVIHSGEDDLESQPAGDAGDRVGCGVIQSDQQAPAE